MWPVRWHGFIDEPPLKPEYAAHENPLPAHLEHAQELADACTPSTVYEFPKAPAEMPPSQPQPALPNDAAMPWWLLPLSPTVNPEPPVTAIETCASEPVPTDYIESVSPRIQAPKLPDWFWEQGTSGTAGFAHLAAQHAAATEQMSSSAESRLERLRGLFPTVGLANLHRNRGPLPDEEQASSAIATAPGRDNPLIVETSPIAPPIEKTADVMDTVPITATPEILSPKEFVPFKEQRRKAAADSGTGWNDEEIRILPAKRGQYGSR
jgi:hypothetical protein